MLCGASNARRTLRWGNPIQFIWSTIGNFQIDGNVITADVLRFEPTIFKWMSFLTGYVLPKAYFEEVGPDGFEAAPIGSGPYMVDNYERNAFIRLKANENYWGGAPEFETVTIKFVTDPAARVAEVESGNSHVTLEVPYEEFDRLKGNKLQGVANPVSDIGMIFFNDIDVMTDPNVRKAAVMAVDKQAIVDRLLSGYGVPIDTLQTPEYDAFDASISTPYDPEGAKALLAESGYGPDNPVRFTIQTTRGFKPKDYEIIQAIVGLWRRVGIEAEIEVYEIAKHFELRATDQLGACGVLQLGELHRGSDHVDRFCHVWPLSAFGLGWRRSDGHDRAALGRGRRRQAHRRLESRRQIHRRQRPGSAAPAICPAHPARRWRGCGAAFFGRVATASDDPRLTKERGRGANPRRKKKCPNFEPF